MTATKLRPPQASKLAASTLHAMNHFQAYPPELASPHSPGTDAGYPVGAHQSANGHGGGGHGGGGHGGGGHGGGGHGGGNGDGGGRPQGNASLGGPPPNGPHHGLHQHLVESHQHFPGNMPPHLHHNQHHHHHHINSNNNNSASATNNNSAPGANVPTDSPNAIKTCSGCNSKIVERFLLQALGGFWHTACLRCSQCDVPLAEVGNTLFTKGGMRLCKTDYARMFGNSGACSGCGQPIPASELVMRVGGPGPGGPMGATSQIHVFHLKCFNCCKCGTQLSRGDRYYMLGAQFVCEQDWHKLLKNPGGPAVASANPGATAPTARKGKVGRPRRSRD